jgi:hypothetical protein
MLSTPRSFRLFSQEARSHCGRPVGDPGAVGPAQAALGGDGNGAAHAEFVESAADQAFVVAEVVVVDAIDVGGVDEIAAAVDESLDRGVSLRLVRPATDG